MWDERFLPDWYADGARSALVTVSGMRGVPVGRLRKAKEMMWQQRHVLRLALVRRGKVRM